MSRGFDGPEIDDFQRPERDVNPVPSRAVAPAGTSSGGWKEFETTVSKRMFH
jgi:hypothetical protein